VQIAKEREKYKARPFRPRAGTGMEAMGLPQ
jgi:hypothetical protein